MNEQDRREQRDAELWRRLRDEARAGVDGGSEEAPDEMTLAAYLDGTLDERAREPIEAWLAAAPEALDLLLAAREALAEPGAAAPEALVRRASALVPDPPGRGLAAWFGGLFAPAGGLAQPLGWSGAAVGVVLACLVGFQLGQAGYLSAQSLEQLADAEAGFVFDPAEEEIL
jgi:hypothetical protein